MTATRASAVDPWRLAPGDRLTLTEADAVIGWRIHRLRQLARPLTGWALDGWTTPRGRRALPAACRTFTPRASRHPAPDPACVCGYRVVRAPELLGELIDGIDQLATIRRAHPVPIIGGRFAAFGRVLGPAGDDPRATVRSSQLAIVPGVVALPAPWASSADKIVLPAGVTVRVVDSLRQLDQLDAEPARSP